AGMSLSTFASWSKNRRRLRKMYVPPIRLMMRKNVAAIRRAGRTDGSICASMIFGGILLFYFFLKRLEPDISEKFESLAGCTLDDSQGRFRYGRRDNPAWVDWSCGRMKRFRDCKNAT